MKKLGFILILILSHSHMAMANNVYFSQLLEEDEPQRNNNQRKFANKTRDALLSYEIVEERANYFARKFRRFAFGDYDEYVMYAAPFLLGKVEFNVSDVRFYIDATESQSGFEYTFNF